MNPTKRHSAAALLCHPYFERLHDPADEAGASARYGTPKIKFIEIIQLWRQKSIWFSRLYFCNDTSQAFLSNWINHIQAFTFLFSLGLNLDANLIYGALQGFGRLFEPKQTSIRRKNWVEKWWFGLWSDEQSNAALHESYGHEDCMICNILTQALR